MTEPTISIIINTFNRSTYLRHTLLSLRHLSYPTFEVIVVNGPSTDGTSELLLSWEGHIKLRSCPEANLSMSRNIGIAAASGEIVAFIDDDASPHPDWLTELTIPYRDPRVGGVGGFTIDNTGVRFQARKTICDRFGNAYRVSPFFDERPLCFPGSPYYPSLLGTNSSFRRSILQEIGGFDHAFAYLLDETDVCLRVVDAGYQIHYAPRAIVFHQFSASHIRTPRRVPQTLYPSAVSKAYFVARHGSITDHARAAKELTKYQDTLVQSNKWLLDHSDISPSHHVSLDQDVAWGIEAGSRRGAENVNRSGGDLDQSTNTESLLPFATNRGLRIVLVSQSFPPDNEAGIARWTSMMAEGLSARGHVVHVVARASEEPSTRYVGGYWLHRIKPDSEVGQVLAATQDLPPNIAAWAAAVKAKIDSLKTFGVDVVSFPIWDVEGIAVAHDCDIGVVMSLHTSYAMAEPFKADWKARPLYRHFMVRRVIAAEKRLLLSQPVILANSNAIIEDLEAAYRVNFADRAVLAPHGTWDPFIDKPERARMRERPNRSFLAVFVGRFEARKGFDIAAAALFHLLQYETDASVIFVGDTVTPATVAAFEAAGAGQLIGHPRVTFAGEVSRSALDDVYAKADVVIMPSRYESFGLVAIEAMAAGAAVVALAAGGLKEIIENGVNGFLVPPDASASERCAEHLIALARDQDRLQAMQKAARISFEERFTVAAMVAAAEPAYFSAVRAIGKSALSTKDRSETHVLEL